MLPISQRTQGREMRMMNQRKFRRNKDKMKKMKLRGRIKPESLLFS